MSLRAGTLEKAWDPPQPAGGNASGLSLQTASGTPVLCLSPWLLVGNLANSRHGHVPWGILLPSLRIKMLLLAGSSAHLGFASMWQQKEEGPSS